MRWRSSRSAIDLSEEEVIEWLSSGFELLKSPRGLKTLRRYGIAASCLDTLLSEGVYVRGRMQANCGCWICSEKILRVGSGARCK